VSTTHYIARTNPIKLFLLAVLLIAVGLHCLTWAVVHHGNGFQTPLGPVCLFLAWRALLNCWRQLSAGAGASFGK
jgi:hypothetical protein